MNLLTSALGKFATPKQDLDYHFIRASLVIVYLFFGYQKWFDYEAQALIPYISHGPLLFWLYPVFGIQGATWLLGVAEWSFAALLFAGFWNKKLGIVGAIGSCFAFLATVTIIPFFPNGWAASAGGFPAMTEHVAFLMKDLVLLAVSAYLLRQDVVRLSLSQKESSSLASTAKPSATGLTGGSQNDRDRAWDHCFHHMPDHKVIDLMPKDKITK